MKIQVLSDIHLEYRTLLPELIPKAPYLFLPGDIGKLHIPIYKQFMDYVSSKWKHVFITLGNHEFYNNKKDVDTLIDEYTEFFEHYDNITLLEQNIAYIEDYCIIGLVLWSYIDPTTDAGRYINCPTHIKQRIDVSKTSPSNPIRTVPIGIDLYNELHSISKEWLLETYNPHQPKTIIMTHYPLSNDSRMIHSKHHNQPQYIKDLFTNNIHLFPSNENSKLVCISGHTHHSADFYCNDYPNQQVRYISNQLGYVDENNQPDAIVLEKVFTLD